MGIEQRDEGWVITGGEWLEDDVTGEIFDSMGPYETKKQAVEAMQGMKNTMERQHENHPKSKN